MFSAVPCDSYNPGLNVLVKFTRGREKKIFFMSEKNLLKLKGATGRTFHQGTAIEFNV